MTANSLIRPGAKVEIFNPSRPAARAVRCRTATFSAAADLSGHGRVPLKSIKSPNAILSAATAIAAHGIGRRPGPNPNPAQPIVTAAPIAVAVFAAVDLIYVRDTLGESSALTRKLG